MSRKTSGCSTSSRGIRSSVRSSGEVLQDESSANSSPRRTTSSLPSTGKSKASQRKNVELANNEVLTITRSGRSMSREGTPESAEAYNEWQFEPVNVWNINPSAEPVLKLEDIRKYIHYFYASLEKRRELMRNSCTLITGCNDNEHYIQEYVNMQLKISRDAQLNGYWSHTISDDVYRRQTFRLLAQRAEVGIEDIIRETEGEKAVKKRTKLRLEEQSEKKAETDEELEKWCVKRYEAPSTRIRITANLTFNENDVIPVYSDLPDETPESVIIPDALLYTYRDTNIINGNTEPELAEALRLSENPKNTIYCLCHSEDPIIPCFRNRYCPCFFANYALHTLQEKDESHETTTFSTFEPIKFNKAKNHMFEYSAFACSELCGCKGACTNNILFLSQKKIFPLELFRKNLNMGFVLRSSVLIPAGTPLMEFTGDLIEDDRVQQSNIDYAFRVTYVDDQEWHNLIRQFKTFTPEYMKLLAKLRHKQYYIDPKLRGNVARTACHSCVANCDLIRVYQKSFSPAHLHLVVVSMEDIIPGVPISIDYGAGYVKQQLHGICLCGSLACHNNERFEEVKKMSLTQLASRIGYNNAIHSRQYRREVERPGDKKFEEWKRLRNENAPKSSEPK